MDSLVSRQLPRVAEIVTRKFSSASAAPLRGEVAGEESGIMWGEREGETEQYMQDHHLMVKGGGSESNVMNGDPIAGGGGAGFGSYPGLQAVSAAELESQHRLLQTDHLLHPHDYRHDQVS